MTTANLGMDLPVVGADSDAWGNKLNTALGLVDAFGGKLMGAAAVTVASASTCDIGAAASTVVAISGGTTITSFGTTANCIRFVTFTGSLVLTHNASFINLPRRANIQTANGDFGIFFSDGSGVWSCVAYMPAGATLEDSQTSASISSSIAQICSVTLTPGKWRLSGNVRYNSTPGVNSMSVAIGATTASTSGTVAGKSLMSGAIYNTGGSGGVSIAGFDVTVTSNTAYYLNAVLDTGTGTCGGYLRAERII